MAAAKLANGLTVRQENFAMAFVELGDASEAYRRAYNCGRMKPHTIHDSAYNLRRHPVVAPRIQQLQAENAQRHAVTVDSLCAELDRMLAIAEAEKQASAGVQAVMAKAKLHGLVTDKTNATVEQKYVVEAPPQAETTEEWLTEAVADAARRKASGESPDILELVRKAS